MQIEARCTRRRLTGGHAAAGAAAATTAVGGTDHGTRLNQTAESRATEEEEERPSAANGP
jgi:hypothetical protein